MNDLLIILEGNELCFKSTIAQKLSDKLGWEVIKGSSFEQSKCTNEELFEKFLNMVVGNENVIIDRWIYSNITYAPLYKDFAMINQGERRLIESMMEISNARLFYLYADEEILLERFEDRGDRYVTSDKLAKINEKFNEVMNEANYKYYAIDTGKYNSDQITQMILEMA